MLGYQWKSLFLPAGTVLRAVLDGENTHAIVEGNHVVFDGKQVSPSGFVNTGGRAVRNAWTSIWILFPQQSVWKLAADCRDDAPRRERGAAGG
jgi:myosin-crossreactive antigen